MLAPMFRRLPLFLTALIAFAILAATCSSEPAAESTTTAPTTTLAPVTTIAETTTTTTAPDTTTTTTEPALVVADSINGMPGDEDLIDRRAVAVKIDNHPNARPQSGLEFAEAVYEIRVEGGLTRFIAVYHQNDGDYIGPNRSGRPTDAAVIDPFDPVFQVSGAQPWVQKILRDAGTRIVYDNGVATYRISSRTAPQNLYVDTYALREYADSIGWADDNPGNLFPFGEPTLGDETATDVTIEFSDSTPARWVWDGQMYQRFIGDDPHEWVTRDGESGQVAFRTVIALLGDLYTVSPPSGTSGSSVPATKTTGAGSAYIFTNGTVVTGTWERDTIADQFVLTTEDGEPITIEPGTLWISIVPDDRSVTWE